MYKANCIDRTKIKRGIFGAMAFSFFLALASAVLALSRFHFSSEAFPTLAKVQWHHTTTKAETQLERPVIVGHRGSGLVGVNGTRIGNSSQAIQRAIDSGVDWIEIDLRATQDSKLILFHDESINLKTNGSGRVGFNERGDGEG